MKPNLIDQNEHLSDFLQQRDTTRIYINVANLVIIVCHVMKMISIKMNLEVQLRSLHF